MDLGALEKIFDISFSPDTEIKISNISLISIDTGDEIQREGDTIQVNTKQLDSEQREFLQELTRREKEEGGRLIREGEEEEITAIEGNWEDAYDDIPDYFDNFLSDRYISIIEDSLYLRVLIEQKGLNKEEILERRRDIARRHGPEAMYMSSLTTAGYFDPNGGLRDLLVEYGTNSGVSRMDLHSELKELVEKKLLCVFINNEQTVQEATHEVRSRIAKYQRVDPLQDWLEIRGIGPECEEIIEGVQENLEDEFMGFDGGDFSDGDGKVIRLHPHSIQDLTATQS